MKGLENVNEKFINKNIGELCQSYDCIRGVNVNIARITPDLIDGLKPVQRRALYIMYLKDQGKTYRKLATISGEVFGRVHPHCLHPDTEFILTNGTKKTIKELYESDQDMFEILTYDARNENIRRANMGYIRITKHVNEYHEIKLTTGEYIRCTEDHRILVMRSSYSKKTKYKEDLFIPTWIRADELRTGDVLYGGEITHLSFEGKDEGYPTIKCEEAGIDVEFMIQDLQYAFIQVESVEIIQCENLPMYDFTVDEYENGVIYIGSRNESSHSFAIVKNSPVSIEDAIVNIAQEWHNSIPLIDGEGNWGSCHDDKTEVLTDKGWMLFKDIDKMTRLATVNPDTGALIYEEPTSITSYHYTGNMIQCVHSHLNFKVTPDHNMIVKKYDPISKTSEDEYITIAAGELEEYYEFRNHFTYQANPDEYSMVLEVGLKILLLNTWLKFIAVFLNNGIMHEDRTKIFIKCRTREQFKAYTEILTNNYIVYDKITRYDESIDLCITNPDVINMIKSYGLVDGKKQVPKFIYQASYDYIRSFLLYLAMYKDCTITFDDFKTMNETVVFTSDDYSFISELQHLAVLSDFVSRIYGETNLDINKAIYELHIYESRNSRIETKYHIFEEKYDGMVYCAEVPTYHTLITRRNNCVLMSGNCSGDPAGASRYIKARLSEYARACFFEDWKESVVDMQPAYDEETMEPMYLPAKYPNVLLNGCLGIGWK